GPERHHTRVKPERHHRRGLFFHASGRLQQTIEFFVLHCFSLAEIFASCCFIFCRARNARNLISAALQPVIFRISSTERPCKYSKSIASRSTGFSAAKRCSTSCREANRRSGASSSLEVVRFSITACSSTLKSAWRSSGRTFSDSIWLRQVFTAIRETQCSIGTLPEYCDNFWKTLIKIIWQRSSSAVRRGRCARTIFATSG